MKNRKIGSIIKNEVERSIKNKWFVILNILMLFTTVLSLNFGTIKGMFKKNNVTFNHKLMELHVEDPENIAYDRIVEDLKVNDNIIVDKKDSVAEYENANIDENTILLKIRSDENEYIEATIATKEAISVEYLDQIESALNSIKNSMVAENKNLTDEEINNIKDDVSINRVMLGQNVENNGGASILQLLSTYLIFFILLLCLNKIANTVSQEKMSKSIEYILTSITTKEYMISKVLSMCLTVVVQFIFMLAYLIIAIMVSSILNTTVVSGQVTTTDITLNNFINMKTVIYILITFVFMCLTVFLQGIIQTVMSAKTTNIQEAGNATILLVMINLILYTVVTAMISPAKSAGILSYILSVIPIASMYFIPSMFIVGQAHVFQIIISLVVLIASIPLAIILTQKPFRNAILDFTRKKEKKINGIEKILSTREYQERIIERKNSSKKGLIIGMSVILLIIIQVVGGFLTSIMVAPISNAIKFISQDNIYLILSCILFAVSIYIPYLLLKIYMPKEEKKKELSKEERKASLLKCIKYIVVSIPILSIIQMVCSFAIEKMGLGVNVTDSLGLFNYNGRLSTILLFIQIAILPAIFEELFIRKGVIGVLKSKGAIFAAVVSSLIFATIHMNTSQFVFAFLVGIVFAIVRLKTNRMYPTMILHFINNGFAVINALFYDHMTFMQIFTYFIIAVNAIGFCLLIYMIYLKVMELKDKESIQKLKEELDYRKIKINLTENLFVFKDFTFVVMVILSATLFVAVEKILALM